MDELKEICLHCKMSITLRNPSGFCDHLHYPENCEVCLARNSKLAKLAADGVFYYIEWKICDGVWKPAYMDFWDGCGKLDIATNMTAAEDLLSLMRKKFPGVEMHIVQSVR